MKHNVKRFISSLIALTMIFNIVIITPAIQIESGDPFSAMYNSDILVAQDLIIEDARIDNEIEMELNALYGSEDSEITSDKENHGIGNGDFFVMEDMILEDARIDSEAELNASSRREDSAITSGRAGRKISKGERETIKSQKRTQKRSEVKKELEDRHEQDRYIVKYKSDSSLSISKMARTSVIRSESLNAQEHIERIMLSKKTNPKVFADELRASGAGKEIEYIQPDFTLSLADFSLEPMEEAGQLETSEFDENSGEISDEPNEYPEEDYEALLEESETVETEEEAKDELWETNNDNPVIVAVIDTGIDASHTMLTNYIIDGWNFTNQTNITYDPTFPSASAHGTHIAGIIAQTAQESGANVQIIPLQVFDNGVAYTSDILAAIEYAVERGANLINCSFGSTYENPALFDAISQTDALLICAVGNNRRDLDEMPSYPASYRLPNIISVGSVNADGGFSYFSNYSPTLVDITAIGRDVVSALPDGLTGPLTGTSMSAGYVTGVAAVVLALDDISVFELRKRILDSADMLNNLQNKAENGRRVNLLNASINAAGQHLSLNPADDFDVHGYQMTESELFELFSSTPTVQVSAGAYHTIILKADGTVWAWGSNQYGQCGTGSTSQTASLSQVLGLSSITEISAGGNHNLARKNDGTIWAWGYNWAGQLGDGTTTQRATPIQVHGLTGVNTIAISAGVNHNLVVINSPFGVAGQVVSWGWNWHGQLGDGTNTDRTTPVSVLGLTGVTAISAGAQHSLALRNDGTVRACGWNGNGQLGDGTTTPRTTPVSVLGLTGVTAISAGGYHSLALRNDGTVRAWGMNRYGQLGDGTTTDRTTPTSVSGLVGVTVLKISAEDYHSFAILNNSIAGIFGMVGAWGQNVYGQLGDGTTINRTIPVRTTGLAGITTISGGANHSISLEDNNKVWVWGDNWYGQLGFTPPPNSVTVPVSVNVIPYNVSVSNETIGIMRNRTITVNTIGNHVFTGNEMVYVMFYNGSTFLNGIGWGLSAGGTTRANQIGYGSSVTRLEVYLFAKDPVTLDDYEGANLIYKGVF